MPREARDLHEPVMLARVVELLCAPAVPTGTIVDATLGMGGHAEALLRERPDFRVLGVDRDPQALALASQRLAGFAARFTGHRGVFDSADEALDAAGIARPSGYLFDLGVSSLQLDSDARGFAYARDTHLDMRMDPDSPVTAADVVNDYTCEELSRVFSQYGEERFSRRIATAIERRRRTARIATSGELTDIVRSAIPAAATRSGHPAKRVFQALRIEVNDELGALRRGLVAAVHRVADSGRIVVMSYHSLEDRIVKRTFAAGINPPVPPDLPVVPPQARPFLRALTRGAEQADSAEQERNPRSRSVRLRGIELIGPVPPGWQGAS